MKFSSELEKVVCFRNNEGVKQQRKRQDPGNRRCNTGLPLRPAPRQQLVKAGSEGGEKGATAGKQRSGNGNSIARHSQPKQGAVVACSSYQCPSKETMGAGR